VFRIRIRTKLLAALAVPLTMIVFVAVVQVTQANDDRGAARDRAAEIEQQARTATSALGQTGALTSLQKARVYVGAYVVGVAEQQENTQGIPGPASVDVETNKAVEELKKNIASSPQVVQDAYKAALANIDAQLPTVQAMVQATTVVRSPTNKEATDLGGQVLRIYNDMIGSLLDANTRLSTEITDPDLRTGVVLLDLASRRSDFELRTLTAIAGANGFLGGTTESAKAELADVYGGLNANIKATTSHAYGRYASAAPPPQDAQLQDLIKATLGGGTIEMGALIDALTGASERMSANGSGPESNATGLNAVNTLNARATELTDQAKHTAQSAADSSDRATALALLGVLAAMLVTFLASLSITRPLRKLTQLAEEMATFKLPNAVQDILNTPLGEDVQVPELEPVYVKTRDEVRDVAAALNVVQESAVGLAVEQAVLRRNIADSFVNLGRRNQNLIGRQLDFITELERNEADPDILENLFKLDHLATRMRRNAESLLVLAGLEPPRQWSAPVDVANIIRASLAEVEGYQRVQQRHLDPATVAGSAAADLAHVLAELIENALVFSPPDSDVEVYGRAGDGVYTLSVVDQGIGMSVEQLNEANSRLAGTESFTVAPSRYLGHYVAGHLARRIGVAIDLLESPSGGVAVRISIPKALLASQAKEKELLGQAPAGPEVATPAPSVARPAATIIDFPVTDAAQPAPRIDTATPDAPAPAMSAPRAYDAPAPSAYGATPAPAPASAPSAPEPAAEPAEPATTASGLKRRVKGANAVSTTPTVINRRAPESSADAAEPNRTDVFRFLTGFQGSGDNNPTNGESK
jgi:signal transduction histidine kinase